MSPKVSAALAAGGPVVALESTIISHGLPRPDNHVAALKFEEILEAQNVTPATIAVVDGVPKVGLTSEDLERIATDESADLTVLSRTPITVGSAGVKSILDIPATLERLETLSVAVVGYRTSRFPAFWLSDSGYDLEWRVDSPEEIADIMAARDAFGEPSALLVANPLPTALQLDPGVLDDALGEALALASEQGIRGKEVSPFLLDRIQQVTGGASVEVNLTIARGNIELAGQIATAWAARTGRAR